MFSNFKNAISKISDSVSSAVSLNGVDEDLKTVVKLLRDHGYDVTKDDDSDLFFASQHGFTWIVEKKESFVIFEFMKLFTDKISERVQNNYPEFLSLLNSANRMVEISSIYIYEDNLCFRSYVNPVGISSDSLTSFERRMIDDITLAVDILENWGE